MESNFVNILLSLTSAFGVQGAIIKKSNKKDIDWYLTLASIVFWVIELTLLILAFFISNNMATIGLSDPYEASTLLTFLRMIFVAIFVLLNVFSGIADYKFPMDPMWLYFYSIFEVLTSVLPIVGLGILQSRLNDDFVQCKDGFNGNPFHSDAAKDTQLTYIHTFVVASLFTRLIRQYSISAMALGSNKSYQATKNIPYVGLNTKNEELWNNRKQQYANIRNSAREETTYNFTSDQGVVRHDLL